MLNMQMWSLFQTDSMCCWRTQAVANRYYTKRNNLAPPLFRLNGLFRRLFSANVQLPTVTNVIVMITLKRLQRRRQCPSLIEHTLVWWVELQTTISYNFWYTKLVQVFVIECLLRWLLIVCVVVDGNDTVYALSHRFSITFVFMSLVYHLLDYYENKTHTHIWGTKNSFIYSSIR